MLKRLRETYQWNLDKLAPEAGNVEKTQKDIPMEPPQASPEAGNVEKTSGRRTSCVVRQRYQLCGQAKAALRFQMHTCLYRAARITNTVGQENHIRHQPQPYKQFSTSSHLSASFKCTTNFHKPDNFLATTLSAVLCDKRLTVISWLFSPRPLLPWSVFSSERMPNLSLHTLKLNSDSGKMVLDSCMRKVVNASGLAWILDNCVSSLAVLWPHGKFFVAWVIEDIHAVGSMSTLQVINQMLISAELILATSDLVSMAVNK